MPFTSIALDSSSSPCAEASLPLIWASSFSSARTWSSTWPMRVDTSAGAAFSVLATWFTVDSSDCR